MRGSSKNVEIIYSIYSDKGETRTSGLNGNADGRNMSRTANIEGVLTSLMETDYCSSVLKYIHM